MLAARIRTREIAGPAFRAGFGGQLPGGDFVAVRDHEACALRGGQARSFSADPGGSGDDENFSLHGGEYTPNLARALRRWRCKCETGLSCILKLVLPPLVCATLAFSQSNSLPAKETFYYNIEWRLFYGG